MVLKLYIDFRCVFSDHIYKCANFPTEWYQSSRFAQRLLLAMALEEGATTSGMIKLDSSNYSLWKPMMEDILYCKDLYEPIVKEKIPTGVEWRVLNR